MRILLPLFFLIFCFQSNAQRNDTDLALYNVLSGTVIGGVGAIINKKPNETFWKTLLRGSSQGALGGYLNFESKRLIRNFTREQDYTYVWPSRLVNAAGNSIIMNGASNYNFGQSWYFNLAFIHLEYNVPQEKSFKAKVMPFAFVGTIDGFVNGSLEPKKSLLTGLFVFKKKNIKNNYFGYTAVNTITFLHGLSEQDLHNTLGHEIIHTYQYNETMPINAFLNRKQKLLENTENGLLEFYNKIFYSDFNYLINISVHGIEDLLGTPTTKRINEIEPYYFGERIQF